MSPAADNPFPSLEMTERATGLRARERLSTNENEFGPSAEAVRAIAAAAGEAHRYPDCDHFALRERLAARLRTGPDTVLVGSGVDGLLGATVRAFLGPGRTAAAGAATYPTFGYFARAAGAGLRTVPYRPGADGLEALSRCAHEHRAEVVYLADPDNPTGSSRGAAPALALADALPAGTLLVVDGAYAEYQDPADRLTARQVTSRRMLWLRTFSKAHALAGLRIGYAIGAPELLGALARGAEHYVVGRVAEAAALASLDATAHLSHVIEATATGRAHYTAALGRLGLTVLPGMTNFVTVRLADRATAGHLAGALAAQGIFVRHLRVPGMTDCLRLTIGPAAQRATVLDAVARYLDHPVTVPAR
ncbi:histidinol-phosphate aminotransferase [Streptomyces sp. NBRC 110611]|uniref:pyridoxal phosphate-dependent aminotransferase n=1 Tax=Streptomyces sp. NBRC 110611 TaxID=1621259 RepID=UPI0008370F5D|nr:aminotransferase class I/II-fold pyridoxal phosphate-dependent enzyme [Streptomyces sp. NBRC 110611]GAU65769.1 histidinol-phosphate aminotransferase [Streptomyces sp. NBRC 110611]